ncbi:MAG TPA: hypothetical protein VK698_14915 [Kofleriaceae bacterium]|nr:hypothetical protein [Kofleriaceae bacterium]
MSEPGRGVQWTGAIAGAVAAVLIALGTISPSWWSGDKGALGMGVGLREVELCASLSCASRGLDGLGSGSAAWPKLGAIGFPMGCVASLFLLVAAAGALVAQKSRWTARFGRAASALSLFALVVGAGFAWTYPGFDGLGAGWGLAAYLGGAAIGVGAGSLLIAGGASRPAS